MIWYRNDFFYFKFSTLLSGEFDGNNVLENDVFELDNEAEKALSIKLELISIF